MIKALKLCNDNHWFIIAAAVIAAAIFWSYGCESLVTSIIDPSKKVNRNELKVEYDYLLGQIKCKNEQLDKQDQIKQELLDAANVIGTGGTINPSGLLNVAATIGAISFGLNRNQQLKNARKEKT